MKTILVTGAARGIGSATAQHLLMLGCRVVLVDRDPNMLQNTTELLAKSANNRDMIVPVQLDLSNISLSRTTIAALPALADGLDGLVNNAAIERLERFEDFAITDIEEMFRVNCLAPIVLMQVCLPALRRKNGSIVNVSSVADERRGARYSVYAATKAFLKTLSRHAAIETGFEGVRINVVSPGGTETPLMDEVVDRYFNKDDVAKVLATIPMEQRWARAEEIAQTIAFALFGPRYLHAADLRVDGGI